MYSRRFYIPLLLFALLIQVSAAFSERLTQSMLASLPADSVISSLLLLQDRPDPDYFSALVEDLPRNERSEVVWQTLCDWSDVRQARLLSRLELLEKQGKIVQFRRLRLVNGIVVDAPTATVIELSKHPDVFRILDDSPQFVDEGEWQSSPISNQDLVSASDDEDELTWSIVRIGAPDMWHEGWNGDGVLVAIIDTGVNYRHTDLHDHLWDGGEEFPFHGYDFHDNDPDPMDTSGHGTAVAGIVAGDGTSGTRTGVAPGATIMCLRVRANLNLGRVSSTWAAQDFVLEHGVDVTSMSLGWGRPAPEDRAIWRNNYDILNIAGIINIKSAGNRRGSHLPPESISVPGRVPSPWRNPDELTVGGRSGMITVGGVDRSDVVASVSSPGPVTWQEEAPWYDYLLDELHPGMIKPDICAPCAEGVTTVYDDTAGYGSFQNTSMAQPHVSGTVALMLSKNHNLLPAQVDSILQTTALDLGEVGKDNDYGAGRVQADLAVGAVQWDMSVPQREYGTRGIPDDLDMEISPNPFNGTAKLSFRLSEASTIRITLFDITGRQVMSIGPDLVGVGFHTRLLQMDGLPSSVYFLRVNAGKLSGTSKILLLR